MNLTGLKLLQTQSASVLAETMCRNWPRTVVLRPANVPIVSEIHHVSCRTSAHDYTTWARTVCKHTT
jgi:hypothetical protein